MCEFDRFGIASVLRLALEKTRSVIIQKEHLGTGNVITLHYNQSTPTDASDEQAEKARENFNQSGIMRKEEQGAFLVAVFD